METIENKISLFILPYFNIIVECVNFYRYSLFCQIHTNSHTSTLPYFHTFPYSHTSTLPYLPPLPYLPQLPVVSAVLITTSPSAGPVAFRRTYWPVCPRDTI